MARPLAVAEGWALSRRQPMSEMLVVCVWASEHAAAPPGQGRHDWINDVLGEPVGARVARSVVHTPSISHTIGGGLSPRDQAERRGRQAVNATR